MQGVGDRRLGVVLDLQVPLVSDGADGEGKRDVVQSSSNKGNNRQRQGGRWRKGGEAILGPDDWSYSSERGVI
jgi:hypothetical protein